jgi:type VI protein secretion system component VasK
MRALVRVAGVVFVLWSVGAATPIGYHGFAKAEDVNRLADAKTADFTAALIKIQARLDEQDATLRLIRVDQVAAKLRELHTVCCMVPRNETATHERMLSEVEETQREYKALTGERYPLPSCDDYWHSLSHAAQPHAIPLAKP